MSLIAASEVARHNSREDCWIVIHEKVYDVTDFLNGEWGLVRGVLQLTFG